MEKNSGIQMDSQSVNVMERVCLESEQNLVTEWVSLENESDSVLEKRSGTLWDLRLDLLLALWWDMESPHRHSMNQCIAMRSWYCR